MPGIRHQGAGINLLRGFPGIPVHGFLHPDGHNGSNQGKDAGNLQFFRLRDFLYALPADDQAGGQQDAGQEDGSHAFHPLVAVGMLSVRFLSGKAHADHDNKSAEYVRKGMHGVGNHGAGTGRQARQQFHGGKGDIGINGYPRNTEGNSGALLHERYPSFPKKTKNGANTSMPVPQIKNPCCRIRDPAPLGLING